MSTDAIARHLDRTYPLFADDVAPVTVPDVHDDYYGVTVRPRDADTVTLAAHVGPDEAPETAVALTVSTAALLAALLASPDAARIARALLA